LRETITNLDSQFFKIKIVRFKGGFPLFENLLTRKNNLIVYNEMNDFYDHWLFNSLKGIINKML